MPLGQELLAQVGAALRRSQSSAVCVKVLDWAALQLLYVIRPAPHARDKPPRAQVALPSRAQSPGTDRPLRRALNHAHSQHSFTLASTHLVQVHHSVVHLEERPALLNLLQQRAGVALPE